jgi:hypothetical protein
MPLLNYTTSISAGKTISEIMGVLSGAGAKSIMVDYNGEIPPLAEALTFAIDINGSPISFRLECKWREIRQVLEGDRVAKRYLVPEHCLNVGWRIIKNWVEAQLALIEAQQAELPQLFLPHAVGKDGKTLYQHVLENKLYIEPGQ